MNHRTDRDPSAPRALVVKIDGLDGCGKTTLAEALCARYAASLSVMLTSEFGSSSDRRIRLGSDEFSASEVLNLLAKSHECQLDGIERELLWAVASRRANRIVIAEALRSYELILVDRSNLGNLAYGTVIDPRLRSVYEFVTTPAEVADIVFWIDTPVEVCYSRIRERHSRDTVESLAIEFFRDVHEQYRLLAAGDNTVRRLDGRMSVAEGTEEAAVIIDQSLLAVRG